MVLATVRRLGWRMAGPYLLVTDAYRTLDLHQGSPAAVPFATAEGVRRWRFRDAFKILPNPIVSRRDAGAGDGQQSDLLVDCSCSVSRLRKGRSCPKSAGSVSELWLTKMRGDLAFALAGGQWSQTLKATVPSFGIPDSQCQLCHAAKARSNTGFIALPPGHRRVGLMLHLWLGRHWES